MSFIERKLTVVLDDINVKCASIGLVEHAPLILPKVKQPYLLENTFT